MENKISFLDLAKMVLMDLKKPLTAGEIWAHAQRKSWVNLLDSSGKTPSQSLAARLYTEVQKPNSEFIKSGAAPARFYLNGLPTLLSVTDSAAALDTTTLTVKATYHERELHPLLVWFADWKFGAHCRTIRHERTAKGTLKQHQWIHPDIVAYSLISKDWTHEVVKMAQSTGTWGARLYSFELKISLDYLTLRESFFQAVSNSSWAHEGYLAAVEIDENPEFRAELTRLSQSFGIGVIKLNIDVPDDTEVLLTARRNPEIDWQTANRISSVNPDFSEFINSCANSLKINQTTIPNFDPLLTDHDLYSQMRLLCGKQP